MRFPFSLPDCILTFPWHKSPSFHISYCSYVPHPIPASSLCQCQFPEALHSITFPADTGVNYYSSEIPRASGNLKGTTILAIICLTTVRKQNPPRLTKSCRLNSKPAAERELLPWYLGLYHLHACSDPAIR